MAVASTSLDIDVSSTARPRSLPRRIIRVAAYGLAGAIVTVFLANVIWKMSGSNRWELEFEKNGVQIYSLKAPGAYVKQFKGVMRAEYSLNHLIAGLIENSNMEVCRNFIPNCIDMQVVEPWSSRTMSDTVMWKLALPPPFSPREVIMQSQVAQDKETGKVVVDIIAAPNKLPRNHDSVRLTHIHNRWIYTPLGKNSQGNHQVEIEFVQDIDMGGLFPDFLQNLAGGAETYRFLHDQVPALLNNEKLKAIKYDFIAER